MSSSNMETVKLCKCCMKELCDRSLFVFVESSVSEPREVLMAPNDGKYGVIMILAAEKLQVLPEDLVMVLLAVNDRGEALCTDQDRMDKFCKDVRREFAKEDLHPIVIHTAVEDKVIITGLKATVRGSMQMASDMFHSKFAVVVKRVSVNTGGSSSASM
jgi:hypothetical protein